MEKTLSDKFCPVSGTNLLLRGENHCGRAFSTSIKFQDLVFKGKKEKPSSQRLCDQEGL